MRAGKERPHARVAVSFRCIIFSFASSRIHKKQVQHGHSDGCRVKIKRAEQQCHSPDICLYIQTLFHSCPVSYSHTPAHLKRHHGVGDSLSVCIHSHCQPLTESVYGLSCLTSTESLSHHTPLQILFYFMFSESEVPC